VLTFKHFLWVLAAFCCHVQAADIHVAVAANFAAPMQKIAKSFEQTSGHKVLLSFGSTGNLYAQIKNGAPFQMFLSADDETPAKLEQEGLGVVATRFVYATGKLVLWSSQPNLVDDQGSILKTQRFQHLAIANPKLAPYGAAAVEALSKLGVLQEVKPKFVQGENIAQTYQFVASGNAPLGFVALSQVMVEGKIAKGSAWVVPAHLHAPLRQEAIVLQKGKDNAAVSALFNHLRSDNAKQVMRAYGYDVQ
jgi:molybdate transport system substrate-binding protein